MSEGRALVHPAQLALAARAMRLPGGRNVLAVSVAFAFRLRDHAVVNDQEWQQMLARTVGPQTVPDTLCPLPGTETLILGPVPAVSQAERRRDCRLVAGPLERRFVLRPDTAVPPAETVVPDYPKAVRDPHWNPEGRAREGEGPRPVIEHPDDSSRPLWLGPTPFNHPLRLAQVGPMGEDATPGWPPGTDPWVLGDAHPAMRAERLDPGDALVLEGLFSGARALPRYRVEVTSGCDDAVFRSVPVRIQTLVVVPAAGAACTFWRGAIDTLPFDDMGFRVSALIAALTDVDDAPKAPDHWAGIAVGRWLDPSKALDDRKLLPRALAATVSLPFAPPGPDDPAVARYEAARAWADAETGAPEENPFQEMADASLPESVKALSDDDPESPPDAEAVGAAADDLLAVARKRHEDAGFDPDKRPMRPTVARGDALDEEIALRLARAHQSESERSVREALSGEAMRDTGAPTPEEALERLATTRALSATPTPPFPDFVEEEARTFGVALARALEAADLPARHIDVAGARVQGEERRIEGRTFDAVLAEGARFEDVVFSECTFSGGTLATASFERCRFEGCTFDGVNLSGTELLDVTFRDCTLRDLSARELTWGRVRFRDTTLEGVALSDVSAHETDVRGGAWTRVTVSDGLWMHSAWRDTALRNVSFASVHGPDSTFERVRMHKVYVTTKGFCQSTFVALEALECGFISRARFDESRFTGCRFDKCGFTGAVFADAVFDPACRFVQCDFSMAIFGRTTLERVRFAQCPFMGSQWPEIVRASEAWFYQCQMRALDLRMLECHRAVFADSDLTDAHFDPSKTVAADFTATVREAESA